MAQALFGLSNYLVPATGGTQSFAYNDAFAGGDTHTLDWKQQSTNGVPFNPSGFVCQPHALASPIFLTVVETGFQLQLAAGKLYMLPYPAPLGHSIQLFCASAGDCHIEFVDYPVIPLVM